MALINPAHVLNLVWDVGTLRWVVMTQSGGGGGGVVTNDGSFALETGGNLAAIDAALDVNLTPLSGSVSAAGNNLLVTPATGKRIRLYYAAYNPAQAGEVYFRFGVAGQPFLRNNLTNGGSVIAKEFGTKYVQGAVNESLYLNTAGGFATIWNTFHVEV